MEKKVMSKEYMQENREEILKSYSAPHRLYAKPALLTKKERKVLGVGKDEGRAIARYVRLSSRKAAVVINLIKDNVVKTFKIDTASFLKIHQPSRSGYYKLGT